MPPPSRAPSEQSRARDWLGRAAAWTAAVLAVSLAGTVGLSLGAPPLWAFLFATCSAAALATMLRPAAQRRSHDPTPEWLEALPCAAAVRDGTGQVRHANAAYQDWLALDDTAIHGAAARRDEEACDARALAGTPNVRSVTIAAGRPEETLHFEIHTRALRLEDEGLVLVCVFDLSAERQAAARLERSLAQQLERLQNTHRFVQRLIDVIPEPVYVKDEQGHYIMVNEAFALQRGQETDDILWRTAQDLAPSADVARTVTEEDLRVLAGENIYKEDSSPHPLTGTPRYRVVTKGSCLNAEGQRVIVGANFDITQRRLSERALEERLAQEQIQHRRTREFIQRIMDLVPFPLFVKDAQSRYQMVNEAMVRDRSIPREALLGHTGMPADASAEMLYRLFEEDGAVLAGLRVLREEHGLHDYTGREYWHVRSKDCCLDPDGNQVIVGAHIDLTDLRRAENELKSSLEREVQLRERVQQFLQRLIDVIPDPVYIKKANGRYVFVNQAFADYHGRDREDIIHAERQLPASTERTRAISRQEDERVLGGGEIIKEEQTVRRITGEEVIRIVTKRQSIYFDGEPVVVGIDHQITRWRQAERAALAAADRERQLRERIMDFLVRLIDVIPDPFYIKKSGGRYVLVNQAFADYYGLTRDEVISANGPMPNSPSESNASTVADDERVLERGEELSFEERTTRRLTGEEVFRVITKRRSVYFDGEPVVLGFNHNVTKWRQAERELQRIAAEDALTGIANRRKIQLDGEHAIALAQRHGQGLSVLLFDLDHFKAINDQWGHQCGDEVLIEVIRRCRETLRQTDLPGRWGGEEFIVLLPHTGLPEALAVAERVRERLAQEAIETSAGPIKVSLSGGVAQWRGGEALDALIARADAALYRAKDAGRNRILIAEE